MNSTRVQCRAWERGLWIVLALLLGLSGLAPAWGSQPADQLIPQAVERLEKQPDWQHALGLAEMRRAAGQNREALHGLARAAETAAPREAAATLLETVCWRMLPVDQAGLADFRRHLGNLAAAAPDNRWLDVFRLIAAAADQDRQALVQAAGHVRAPAQFPTVAAEKAHLALLVELGLARNAAGLEVIRARAYQPLYALRDLDRSLSREAEFFDKAGRVKDAESLRKVRDTLRAAWLDASGHLVERLFALNLAGKQAERSALAERAARLAYLQDQKDLDRKLAALSQQQAWTSLIEPLLASEVALIDGPPAGRQPATGEAELTVRARLQRQQNGSAIYEGPVEVSLGRLSMSCARLELTAGGPKGKAVLKGADNVVIRGVPGFDAHITADRFAFDSAAGEFKLEGNVQLQSPGRNLKCEACTITAVGEITRLHTVLDDFAEAEGVQQKLALLPKIAKVYGDDELPPEVRYLLAMKLLRAQLTWHASYAPPDRPVEAVSKVAELALEARATEAEKEIADWRWSPAHGGEEWMLDDVPREKLRQAREQLEKRIQAEREKRDPPQRPLQQIQRAEVQEPNYFWRLKNPQHADVLRAVKLLQGVGEGDLVRRARHWLEEIARNNTVVTIDAAGAYWAGQKGPVVVDVRNADRLSVKLFRVRRPDDLVAVTQRIGEDFIFRDYGLEYGGHANQLAPLRAMRQQIKRMDVQRVRVLRRVPEFQPEDLVQQWNVDVARMTALDLGRQDDRHRRYWDDEDDDYDQQAALFNDRCEQYRERLEKKYWPGWQRLSSWQCDRLLEVPAAALKEAGAYVLAVEANGQTSYAPILVDPLSLVLRRCRDGVFALVSDTDAEKPAAGAQIHAADVLGKAVTNADGVTFARVFAAGDRALIAEKDGRFAIGGFGAVFDGIYKTNQDDLWDHGLARMRMARLERAVSQETLAHAYTDRYVVAAYTDRPTYRPGQEVHFKVIVRRLPLLDGDGDGTGAGEFRAGDFDWADRLEIPERDSAVRFEALNPAGRVVGSDDGKLNDFGTAAGKITLPSEAKVGSYTLRVHVGGMDRIVPEAFAVKYYRRPNFEVHVAGLPETLSEKQVLSLQLSGRYYFGKPVAGSKADVRLVGPRDWKPLASAQAALDQSGAATLELRLPERLEPGPYRLVAALTDQSGRTATEIQPCRVGDAQTGKDDDPLGSLPRFVAVEEPLKVKTTAAEVVAVSSADKSEQRITFKAENGAAEVRLPTPGWYALFVGGSQKEIFAYGGDKPPVELSDRQKTAGDNGPSLPRWINLTGYAAEEDRTWRYHHRYDEERDAQLLALLDRQQVRVGDTLRVLLFVPNKMPRVLLTIEGRTVVDYVLGPQATALTQGAGSYCVIEIPVKRRYLPNFYLQGRILSGKHVDAVQRLEEKVEELAERLEDEGDGSEDPRWCRVDVIDPDLRPGGQRLSVAVETDSPAYRPGEKVGVRIKATDLKGQPVEAEVSLAAVDESVFSFGEDRADGLPQCFNDPHPERRYMRKTWRVSHGKSQLQRLQQAQMALARAMESMKQMAQQDAAQATLEIAAAGPPLDVAVPVGLLAGELPATSMALGRLRTDFRETAAWQPQLRTGRDGLAETSFVLPDSLTRYRLTSVGLTRQTDMGVGRAQINVAMPMSVQLFLPRFAVEQDRLEAVGLVHNNGDRERTCDVVWEVVGAKVEASAAGAAGWETVHGDGKLLRKGRVTVPAGQPVRLALPLVIDRLDDVRVTLRAGAGNDADAESRTVAVQPLGRQREVAMSGTFQGRHDLNLPAGFVAFDLRLAIARADAAGAMEGLGYLIGYPYGCVEQTMSRFLPAVMVKRAAGEAVVTLAPEAAEKLPDVLRKGLDRLYNFQHPDGGWGWWEKDQSNDGMTTYVVYGLARCRNTGTEVDDAVLARGCEYLRKRLAEGKVSAADRPAAWLAVALAGAAETASLRADAQQAHGGREPGAPAAYLALACKAAGLIEPGERLAARLRAWEPELTEQRALKLCVQVAFGAPLEQCRTSAAKLLARRNGPHWENTRTTAWAIEALSQMLRYDTAAPKPKRITITVGGKAVLDLSRPEQLETPVCRVHLDRASLPALEAIPLRMNVEGDHPVNFTLSAAGVQRLDKLEPEERGIKLTRTLTTPDGKPLSGGLSQFSSGGLSQFSSDKNGTVPLGSALRVGDVVAVHVTLDVAEPQSYLIVEDRRPAGCEFADEHLDGPAAATAANVEFRDDRVAAFFTSLPKGRHEMIYYLRAETRGTSHVLPGVAYPMYNNAFRGESTATKLQIE